MSRWSKVEDDLITKVYLEEGTSGLKNLDIGRTYSAMLSRIGKLKITRNKPSDWTEKEIEVLKKYYNEEGVKGCQDRGVDKTVSSIYTKAFRLGLRSLNDVWSESELELLREIYPQKGVIGCQEHGLQRSAASIKNKAQTLNIRMKSKYITQFDGCWSANEEEILRKVYPTEGVQGCQRAGIDRTPDAIKYKARVLGVKVDRYNCEIEGIVTSWSREEIALLKEFYEQGGSRLCRQKGINKEASKISKKAYKLGLKIKRER